MHAARKITSLVVKNYYDTDLSNRNNTLLYGKLVKLGSIGNFMYLVLVRLYRPSGTFSIVLPGMFAIRSRVVCWPCS
jgi:hypothetical protein